MRGRPSGPDWLGPQARDHIHHRLDPPGVDILLPEREELEQRKGLLRLLERSDVLQYRSRLTHIPTRLDSAW